MAAVNSSRCRLAIQQILRKVSKARHISKSYTFFSCRSLSVKSGSTEVQDPVNLFLLPDVQRRLYKISGFDLYTVFRTRQTRTDDPKYKLLTDEQLHELQEDAIQRGLDRLQMPPYLKPKEEVTKLISDDPDIADFDTANYVFTDITFGLPDQSRLVVVREPGGALRHAQGDERRRMYQVYNPRDGRMMFTPTMFEEENLETVLEEERYEYVLDRACLQFEPDDPDFIRVSHRTFEYIASMGHFDALRSTRHFGPMAYYFACTSRIDRLLSYFITCDQIDDAADLLIVYHTIHPTCKTAVTCREENITDPVAMIKAYLAGGEGAEKAMLELALQSYLDTLNEDEVKSSDQ